MKYNCLIRILFIIMGLVTPKMTIGQQFNFTQYQNTPLLINPAMVSTFDDMRLYLNYRNQRIDNGDGFHSSSISGIRPLVGQGFNRISLGFLLLDDRNSVRSNFVQQKAGLSLGINLAVQKDQQVSLGIGADYIHRRFSTDGLSTGSQYVENRGFDPGIANGEDFDRLTNNYMGLSLGMVWTQVDVNNMPRARIALAWKDFNKPDDSFFDQEESRLPSTLQVNASYRIYENSKIDLTPEMLFTQSNGENTFQLGSAMGYNLNQNKKLDLRGGVLVDKGVYAGFQFIDPAYEVGFSYDFPVGSKADAFDRTLEFSLILKKPVVFSENTKVRKRKKKVPKSNRITKAEAKAKAKEEAKAEEKDTTKNSSGIEQEIEQQQGQLQEGGDIVTENQFSPKDSVTASVQVGEITPEGLEIETISRNIEFDFNSTHVTEHTHLYLDPLAEMLKAYPETKIIITGHTDNVGRKQYNKQLSLKRAQTVQLYLLERGVSESQIQVIGMGDEQPVDTNKTKEGRSRNRRVEIELVSGL